MISDSAVNTARIYCQEACARSTMRSFPALGIGIWYRSWNDLKALILMVMMTIGGGEFTIGMCGAWTLEDELQ